MKKLILLSALLIFACSSDDNSEDNPLPAYTIEGKWVWSPSENRADTNTMYEFVDGVRYTYYCLDCPGDDGYWNSLVESDRIPGSNPYSVDSYDTLRVDLDFGNQLVTQITFECDGGKLLMDGAFSHLWRLNSDCN
jgi:hypothetical protein